MSSAALIGSGLVLLWAVAVSLVRIPNILDAGDCRQRERQE